MALKINFVPSFEKGDHIESKFTKIKIPKKGCGSEIFAKNYLKYSLDDL